jgi:two-component system sensor histidine kinase TctE
MTPAEPVSSRPSPAPDPQAAAPAPGSRRAPSLRGQLIGWLVAPLALLLIVGLTISYGVALRSTTDAYDSELLDPALALAQHLEVEDGRVRLDLSPVAQDVLRIDSYDRIYFAVFGPSGELVAGDPEMPPPPRSVPTGHRVFYDGRVNGQAVRIAALFVPQAGGSVVIQVAETMIKRSRLTREILFGEMVPDVLIALAALVLTWFGIARALSPLDRLRAEIAQRSARDLSALAAVTAPREVEPMVDTLNGLLRELRAAIEAQQRFTANAAHQLRTPLAGLQTQVELALRQTAPPEMQHTLRQLHGATIRLTHLANQLLALARAEPGGHRPDTRRTVDLRTLAQEAAGLWVPRAIAHDLDLGFDLESAPLHGDPRLLRDLLDMLIENAIDYTPAGGHITVVTRADGGGCQLSVEDDGPGIPADQRDRVFQRFYRIPGAAGEGSGLGLAIAREIVNLHQGRIAIDDGPGERGTAVKVWLPGGAQSGSRGEPAY